MVVFRFIGSRAALRRQACRQPRHALVALEQLEDRCVPSTGPLTPPSAEIMSPTYKVLSLHPSIMPMGGPGSQYGYTPTQMRQAYGFNLISFPSGGRTIAGDGTGQTIAIVDAYDDPNIAGDLAAFDSSSTGFGLPAPPSFTKVGIDANGNASTTNFPSPDPGWSVEISLDVEWAHAIAPAANIVLVEAYSAYPDDLINAVNYAAQYAGTAVVSMSWGGSEFSGQDQYDSAFTTPSGHSNVTFVASSGDSGAGVIWPSVSSHVVATGGTSLRLDSSGNYGSESGWSGSGGGISGVTRAPGYQQNLKIYSGDPQANGMRAVPDVAYDADPNTGVPVYATYGSNGWLEVGGTSASSPQWAALFAIADQGRALHGTGALDGFTQALPDLYKATATDYHDITGGSNGYPAGAGFDVVTGLGAPRADQLMPDLGAPMVQQVLTTVAISPANATVGDGGQVQFSAVGYDQFNQPMVPQPSFSWQLLTSQGTLGNGGLYTAPASGTGSDTVQVTASAGGVTVTNTTSVNYTAGPAITGLTANPIPVTGTTTTLSAALSDPNAGNLNYTWSVVSSPGGATAPTLSPASGTTAPGSISTTATFSAAGSYTFQLSVTDASGIRTSSTVSATVNQTLTSVTVAPGSASVTDGKQQQFTATVDDQFGQALAAQPSFSWSVVNGKGTIDGTGLYTAPATGSGADTVQASAPAGSTTVTGTATANYSAGLSIVSLTADPNPVTGKTTTLTAQISDPNSPEIDFNWINLSPPNGAPPTITPPSGSAIVGTLTATVTFSAPGTYVFELYVTDLTQTATAMVTVNVSGQGLTITSLTANPNPVTGNTTTLTAQISDPYASYVGYGWTVVSQPPLAPPPQITPPNGFGFPGTLTATATFGAPGTYVIKLDVRDGSGQTASDTVTVNVIGQGGLTITSLTATPNPVTGSSTTLAAQISDPYSSFINYGWSVVSQPASAPPPQVMPPTGTTMPGTLTATATFGAPGTYVFELEVRDGSGQTASDRVTVDVTGQGLTITSLTANPSPVVGASGALVAQVADGYSANVEYNWSVIGTPLGAPWPQLSPPSGSAPVGTISTAVTYFAPGTYVFELDVMDTNGQTASDTVSVTVDAATPTIALTANPSPVTGNTTALSGAITDANEVSPNYGYSWSVVSAPTGVTLPTFSNPSSGSTTSNPVTTTARFYGSGLYQLQLQITDTWGATASSTVSVTVAQTLTSVTVSPANVTLAQGATQQFTAQALDQFHQALSPQPSFNWLLASGPGTLGSAGLYTAPTTSTGTAVVQAFATVGGITVSGSATVTVTAPAPVISNISANPNPVTGTTTTLSVTATDPSGGALAYAWSVLSRPAGAAAPSFGASTTATTGVVFYAAGSYTFQVTVTSKLTGASTTATVTVTVAQTLRRVSVSPALSYLHHGQTLQLTATAFDQFLNPLSGVSFTWSKASGPGTVSSSGLYTAPTSGSGKAIIKATATVGGVTTSGSATIYVS